MSPKGFRDGLRVFLVQKPFIPFSIEFVSGAQIEIRHPEALDIRNDLVLYRAGTGDYSVFESTEVARLLSEPANRSPKRSASP